MPKKIAPADWLAPALDYARSWIDFQVERYKQPGCAVAIAKDSEVVAQFACGVANLRTSERLTPRHRFRIASHSKSFTASAVMLLREQGKLSLDDPIGRHVAGLHKNLAGARVAELLSHGGGVTRDGDDSGQFADRRPYLSRTELRAELARKQPMEPGIQLKYSNHGFGLLGLMIEEITGTDYSSWVTRHVIRPAGLRETVPDMPLLPKAARMATGHTMEFPFGQRLLVPGDNVCDAIAPAGGFVSTASDVAAFFAQLAPEAKESILSAASRRETMQRRWRDNYATLESHYGFGTMISAPGPKEWCGHTGSLQGFVSRTARFTGSGFTITVLCNAQDGPSWVWVDGIASILGAFAKHGAPSKRVASWAGRWWSMWGAADFVPMGNVVCQVGPAMNPPFDDAVTELSISGRDTGLITKTSAYNSPGQPIRRVRNGKGKVTQLWIAGSRLLPKKALVAEVTGRYRGTRRGRTGTAS
jgi:D-alanyl-D-alanine carboxypeptidase